MDALGCALLALRYPECTKLLGPVVPGTIVPDGTPGAGNLFRPGSGQAAFNIGIMIRWLDYNDTWLAAEWGHPSDNLGGILAVADYVRRKRIAKESGRLTIQEVLTAMIKAHEIQGCLALENSFNRVGLDHVVLVKVASTAVVTALLGGGREQMSPPCPRPGSTARACAPTAMRPTPVRANRGPPETPPAAGSVWPC